MVILKVIEVYPKTEPRYDVADWFGMKPFISPRIEQKQIIPLILEELANGTKNIIVESPTGSGKSAISYFIPQISGKPSYVLTHLKGLQDQYAEELPIMKVVKGRSNYKCNLNVPANCEDIEVLEKAIEDFKATGVIHSDNCTSDNAPCTKVKNFNCSFKFSIEELHDSDSSFSDNSSNFCGYFSDLAVATKSHFFLTNMNYLASAFPTGNLLQRDLLIVDEAHNLESALMSHYSLDFTLSDLEMFFGVPTRKECKGDNHKTERRNRMLEAWSPKSNSLGFPNIPSIKTNTDNRVWSMSAKVFQMYFQNLSKTLSFRIANEKISENDIQEANILLKKIMLLTEKMNDWENWVWTKNDELNPSRIKFKPLSVKTYAEDVIHSAGNQRVFISATIGDADVFRDELGLDSDSTTFIRINYSSFPIENRPIYTHIVGGNLSYNSKSEMDYFQTAKAIKKIAWRYKGKKGLILPYTKANQEEIIDAINTHFPIVARRIRTHSDEPKQREEDFKSFNSMDSDDILISTYANQGYDGKDVSFCIIVKVPFASLGDIQVKKRTEMNPKWYKSQTANLLTQMCGRVVRSKEDVGDTYIIDPQFLSFFDNKRGGTSLATEMPKYVVESIENYRGCAE